MDAIIIDPDAKATQGILALAAQSAADEIRDYLIPLMQGFIDIDLPLSAEMHVYYVDDLSKDTRSGSWGPIEAENGDVVVHLKAKEDEDGVGNSSQEEERPSCH